LSRCNSKLRIISSKDVPVSGPDCLNCHPQLEQPKPRKRCCSTHASFRLIARLCAQTVAEDAQRGGQSLQCANLGVCRASYMHWEIFVRAEHCIICRVFEDRLWKAKASKPCSPASARIPKGNHSATNYFYRSPI